MMRFRDCVTDMEADNFKSGFVTIIGRPNVGKSSVFNAMTGEEKAIVTDVPGTTRDTIETLINYEGLTLNIFDTAGIHSTEDRVEKIGIERTKDIVKRADLILAVFDISEDITKEDEEIIELCNNKKSIAILNKADLEEIFPSERIEGIPLIKTSAKTGSGIEDIFKIAAEYFFSGELSFNDEIYITNARQAGLLREATKSLKLVLESIENKMSEDFYTSDLMDAYSKLGEIIGEEVKEDLIDTIFKDFCMGK